MNRIVSFSKFIVFYVTVVALIAAFVLWDAVLTLINALLEHIDKKLDEILGGLW